MLAEVIHDHARQRYPKLANRFLSVLPSCIVHADTMLGRDERCR